MSNITATQILSKVRKGFDDDLTSAKRRKATLNTPSVRDGFKLLAKILKKALEVDSEAQHSEFVYTNATKLDADVYVNTESLKTQEVMELLEFVEKHVAEASRSEDYASSSMAQRTFGFCSECLRLNLTFRLPTDGDACSRVKVGTKMVERDSYAIRCA